MQLTCQYLIPRCLFLLLLVPGLTACSTGMLRDVTAETSATTTDILYEEALSNVAMTRFYNGPILPASYEISAGSIAVNDTIGVTPGLGYSTMTHILNPSVTFPTTRAFQKTWNVTPQDNLQCLQTLKAIYRKYAFDDRYKRYFQSQIPMPVDSIAGKYRGCSVWVDARDAQAMTALTSLVEEVLAAIQKADKETKKNLTAPIPPTPTSLI